MSVCENKTYKEPPEKQGVAGLIHSGYIYLFILIFSLAYRSLQPREANANEIKHDILPH